MADRSLSSPRIVAQVNATVRNAMDDGQISSGSISSNTNDTLTSGVGHNQADRGWQYKEKTLLSGVSITIDLYDLGLLDVGGGVGLDCLGQAMEMQEIVTIKIKNNNAVGAVGDLEIIPALANGWTPIGSHTVATGGALRGGGVLLKHQPDEGGFAVTDAANNQITLTANGGDITYSIYVLARHDSDESSSSSSSTSSSSSSSQSDTSSSSSSPSSTSSSSQSSSSCISTSSSSQSNSSLSSSSSSSLSTSSSSPISTSSSFSSQSSMSSSTSSSESCISTSSSSQSSSSSSSISTSSVSCSSWSSFSSLSSLSSVS